MKPLNELKAGATGRVSGIATSDPMLEAKLREIGFAEGDEVELLTRGPFGGQPLAVRLNRTIVALRTLEAKAVRIVPIAETASEAAGEPLVGSVTEPQHA